PWAAPHRGGAIWRKTEIPSANGHGTALSTAQLYGTYANGGMIGASQVISPQTHAAIAQRRIFGEDLVLPYVMDWGSGLMRNNNLIYGPNPETLAHAGWGGAIALGDPDKRLSAAYVMNKQWPSLQGDERSAALVNALYAAL